MVVLGAKFYRKGFSDSNLNNSSDGLKGIAKPKKVEKLQKRNIQFGDGAKYMSYIKVIYVNRVLWNLTLNISLLDSK